MAMDQPTRIGIGAAAGIALMSIAEPHFYEPHPVWTILIYGTLGGLMVWGFGIPHAAVLLARWLRRNARRMWPQYLMLVCGIGFFVGLVAFLQINAPGDRVAPSGEEPQSKKTETSAALPSQPSEHIISLDMAGGMLPRTSPPDGILHLFEVRDEQDELEASRIDYQLGPSALIDWKRVLPDWPIFGVSKGEITSATNDAVFYATIALNLSFREMVPETPGLPAKVGDVIQSTTGGGQTRSGPVIKKLQRSLGIDKVYPQTPYVIYFVNRTKYLVEIEVSPEGKTANFNKAGDAFEEKLRIKLQRETTTSLVPSRDMIKSPPAQHPPTQAPPSAPEKK